MMLGNDGEVEFQLVGGSAPVIVLQSFVNGKGPYNFILDSGASHCLISPELAADLALHVESQDEAFGAGGAVQVSFVRMPTLTVGPVQQLDTQAMISDDLKQIGAALKLNIDGNVGLNFLKDFRTTIDYQRKRLGFARSFNGYLETRPPAFLISFTLAPSEPMILVEVLVNDQGPFQFALDTGAGRSVITPQLAERLQIESIKAVTGAGVGGKVPMNRVKLNSLTVGGATIQDHLAIVAGFMDSISTAVGAKLDGIVGNNFLNQFHVTLDYPQRLLGFSSPDTL